MKLIFLFFIYFLISCSHHDESSINKTNAFIPNDFSHYRFLIFNGNEPTNHEILKRISSEQAKNPNIQFITCYWGKYNAVLKTNFWLGDGDLSLGSLSSERLNGGPLISNLKIPGADHSLLPFIKNYQYKNLSFVQYQIPNTDAAQTIHSYFIDPIVSHVALKKQLGLPIVILHTKHQCSVSGNEFDCPKDNSQNPFSNLNNITKGFGTKKPILQIIYGGEEFEVINNTKKKIILIPEKLTKMMQIDFKISYNEITELNAVVINK